MDFSIVKKHPYAIGGGIAGLLVLWLLLRSKSGGGSSANASGTSVNPQLAALDAATQIQQSQIDTGLQVSQLQAGVANNQTAAAVQNTQATLDAQLQAVTITSAADVVKTKLEADTYQNIAKTQALVLQSRTDLQKFIYQTLASQKKLGGSSTGVSQIIAALQGQGPAAIAANQPSSAGSSPASIIGASGQAAGSIFKGLFGLG